MSEAWFSPETAYWFSALGLLGLTALAVPSIARGRHRAAVLGVWSAIIVLGLGFFVVGVIAWFGRQPGYVTLPLVISGALMAAGYAFSLIYVLRIYRLAEQRKMAAREL